VVLRRRKYPVCARCQKIITRSLVHRSDGGLREIGAVNTLDQNRGSDDLKHTTMDHKNARSSSASETVRIIAFNPVKPMAVMYQPKSAPNHNGKTTEMLSRPLRHHRHFPLTSTSCTSPPIPAVAEQERWHLILLEGKVCRYLLAS
jgi:hypothetical protein